MADDPTPRLQLPPIQPGQAQKEVTHNETLARLDIAVHAAAEAILAGPPSSPAPGACWIVDAAPTGAWAGRAGQLAGWTVGGWRFVAPPEGMTAWLVSEGLPARFSSGSWHVGDMRAAHVVIGGQAVLGARQPAVADPTGGTTVDSEARAAIVALLAAARAHGLIAG